jgi:hypothetical protein
MEPGNYFLVVSAVVVVVVIVVSAGLTVVSTGRGVTVVLVSTVVVVSVVVVLSELSLQATIVAAIAKTAKNFFIFVVRF